MERTCFNLAYCPQTSPHRASFLAQSGSVLKARTAAVRHEARAALAATRRHWRQLTGSAALLLLVIAVLCLIAWSLGGGRTGSGSVLAGPWPNDVNVWQAVPAEPGGPRP